MSETSKCESCLWGNKCRSNGECYDYYPIFGEIDDDKYIEELERNRREEFLEQWEEYSSQHL